MTNNFQTHNDTHVDINMTHLLGYCEAHTTFADLCSIFGKPDTGDEYKVDAQWSIKFDDGKVASIYNYKTGKNYLGKEGFKTEDLRGEDWHIGGKDPIVVERVHKIVRDFLRGELAAA